MTPEEITDFWFKDHANDWWSANDAFDQQIVERYTDLHARAEKGELWQWRETPLGALAEVIVLDQFSRQLFRQNARAFASDSLALAIAQYSVAQDFHSQLDGDQRLFLLMPYQHSESLIVQKAGRDLFQSFNDGQVAESVQNHIALIERFGRFPKRNKALGRISTQEELDYMAEREGKMY